MGFYDNSRNAIPKTLIESRNGGSWLVARSPNPGLAGYNVLNGVSCASASACTAVGFYDDGRLDRTLIESS